jgi:sugar-specific transcriptional regulator TrmB
MNTLNKLIQYGLNKAEATVYLDVLSHLDSSAFAIYKRVGLPKTSVYHLLESLRKRNLVESWKKNNIQYFSAGSPKRFLSEIKEKEDLVHSLIPDLLNFSDKNIQSNSIKMYEGNEGLKTMLQDSLEYCEKNKINSMLTGAINSFSLTMPKFIDQWIKNREALKISVKMLAQKADANNKGFESNSLRETRFLPQNFDLPGIINIYGDRVDLFSAKNDKLNAVVIESKVYADLLRNFFLLTWNTAEKAD